MSEIAMNAAHMIDMLPDPDKNLAYELIKKLVLAWDPDFTKLTTEEAKQLEEAKDSRLCRCRRDRLVEDRTRMNQQKRGTAGKAVPLFDWVRSEGEALIEEGQAERARGRRGCR